MFLRLSHLGRICVLSGDLDYADMHMPMMRLARLDMDSVNKTLLGVLSLFLSLSLNKLFLKTVYLSVDGNIFNWTGV